MSPLSHSYHYRVLTDAGSDPPRPDPLVPGEAGPMLNPTNIGL